MKIAVSSANQKQVTGPASLCPTFWIYDTDKTSILSKTLIRLNETETLIKIKGKFEKYPNHVLANVNCIISRYLGDGLYEWLHENGIKTLSTNVSDPDTAVLSFLKYADQVK